MRALVFLSSAWLASLLLSGCGQAVNGNQQAKSPVSEEAKPSKPQPGSASKTGRKEIGKNVYLEIEGDKRRVLVDAEVCLRQGFLEHLLSRTQAEKFHESILTSELDAQHIHVALLAAGAQPGKPVQFRNEKGEEDFKPPTGDKIRITLQYEENGKTVRVAGQRWVRDFKTKKELKHDWVFAGSRLYYDPEDKKRPPFYGANEGRVICLSNFANALLDLPIRSDEGDPNEGLLFEANKELIPPEGTKVTVILEPVAVKK